MLSLILLRMLLPLLLARSFHAVHISYGDVSIDRASVTGNLTFFKDDWTKAIGQWYGRSYSTMPLAEQRTREAAYLTSHVRMWVNTLREPLPFSIRLKSDDGLSITYEIVGALPGSARSIIVDSRAVFSLYGDQMNLMTVKTKDATINEVFTASHPSATITL